MFSLKRRLSKKKLPKKIVTPAASEAEALEGIEAMERGLKAVYLDAKGSVPDLGRMERASSWRWLKVLGAGGAVCLLFASTLWAGVWLFEGNQAGKKPALALEIHGPTQVTLGEEQTYEVVWRATDKDGLQELELRLNAPADFTVTRVEPPLTNATLRVWRLGRVAGHSQGRLRVKGFFVGSLGSQTALQVLSVYRVPRAQTALQAAVLHTVTYTGTVLAGNLLFPERVVAGELTHIRYLIANLGQQPMRGLQARLSFPAGFIPAAAATSVEVDLAERRATYVIGALEPNTFYTAILRGVFASGMSGDAVFQAETGHLGVDGSFLAAARSESRLAIAPGDLALRLVANGTDTTRSIEAGEPLRVTLGYENTSREPMRDLQLAIELESLVNGQSASGTSLLDWSEIDDDKLGTSSTRTRIQTIVYDQTSLASLAEILPGSQGSLEVGWPTLPVASGTKDALIRIVARARLRIAGGKTPRLVRSQPVALVYRSDVDVRVEARYFTEEGAPLGSGPLPPVVGKTTTYRVYWQVRNSLHDLNETRLTAVLPKIVAWTDKTEAELGTLSYDAGARTVTWNIGRVPEDKHEVEGWFELALTPQAVDAGRFAALLGETSLQTQDARLNEALVRTKPDVSTDLSHDEGARGKGVVRRE